MAEELDQYEGGDAPDVATAPPPATSTPTAQVSQPAAQPQAAVWQPWDSVASDFRTAFPEADQDALRKRWEQGRQLSIERARYAGAEQQTPDWIVERAAPFGSSIAAARQTVAYGDARHRLEQGNPNEGDYELIASYERREATRLRDQGTVYGRVTDALARVPAIAGEFYAGGAILKGAATLFPRALGWLVPTAAEAAPSILTREGALAAARGLPGSAARGVAMAPMTPSAYLDSAVRSNVEAGRQPYDPSGFPAPLALAAIQNTIFGSMGQVGVGPGDTVLGAARNIAARTGVGLAEKQIADTLASAAGLETGYGTIGALLRGEGDEAFRGLAADAVTFAAFAAMHAQPGRRAAEASEGLPGPQGGEGRFPGSPEGGGPGSPGGGPEIPGREASRGILDAFRDALNWYSQRRNRYPESVVGRIFQAVRQDLDTFMARNPDATRAEAQRFFTGTEDMPVPLRRFVQSLAEMFPEQRQQNAQQTAQRPGRQAQEAPPPEAEVVQRERLPSPEMAPEAPPASAESARLAEGDSTAHEASREAPGAAMADQRARQAQEVTRLTGQGIPEDVARGMAELSFPVERPAFSKDWTWHPSGTHFVETDAGPQFRGTNGRPYRVTVQTYRNGALELHAIDAETGEQAGMLVVDKKGDKYGDTINIAHVKRAGIARALYDYVSDRYGPVVPGDSGHTPEGKEFWEKNNVARIQAEAARAARENAAANPPGAGENAGAAGGEGDQGGQRRGGPEGAPAAPGVAAEAAPAPAAQRLRLERQLRSRGSNPKAVIARVRESGAKSAQEWDQWAEANNAYRNDPVKNEFARLIAEQEAEHPGPLPQALEDRTERMIRVMQLHDQEASRRPRTYDNFRERVQARYNRYGVEGATAFLDQYQHLDVEPTRENLRQLELELRRSIQEREAIEDEVKQFVADQRAADRAELRATAREAVRDVAADSHLAATGEELAQPARGAEPGPASAGADQGGSPAEAPSRELTAQERKQREAALKKRKRSEEGKIQYAARQQMYREAEAEAAKFGVSPEALHEMAGRVKEIERGAIEDHNRFLREVRRLLKHYGVSEQDVRKYKIGAEANHIDEVAASLVADAEFSHKLGREHPLDTLVDLIRAGNRQPIPESKIYNMALSALYDERRRMQNATEEVAADVNRELTRSGAKRLSAAEVAEVQGDAESEVRPDQGGNRPEVEAEAPAGDAAAETGHSGDVGTFDPAEFGEPDPYFAVRPEQGRLGFASSERPMTLHEAQQDVDARTARTTLDRAWQEANPPPPDSPEQAGLFGALRNLAEDIVKDESGHFDWQQFVQGLRDKWTQVKKAVDYTVDGVGRLGGKMFPGTTRIDQPAGEALARLAVAETYARLAADHFTAKVLGENATPADRLLAGAVMTERRLRYMRMAYQRAGDATAAAAVKSIIGAPGSPLQTFADYRRALFSPEMQAILQRWQQEMVPVLDATYRKAQGLNPNDPIDSLTQIPGQPINLKPEYGGPNTPPTVATPGGSLKNLRARKLPFSSQATGAAPAYDLDLGNIIENSLVRGIPIAAKADALRELYDAGLLKWGHDRQGIDFNGEHGVEFPNVKPPSGTQAAQVGQTSAYLDPRVAEEFRNALNIEQVEGYKKTMSALAQLPTVATLASSVEAATHSLNLVGGLYSPGVRLGDFFKNLWQRTMDYPRARERLLRLAEMGALKAKGLESGTVVQSLNKIGQFAFSKELPESAKYLDPTYYGGKLLDGLSDVMRLTLADAYDRLAASGAVHNTQTGKRDFINQALGQYEKKAQNGLVRWVRETGLGPFATAGTTMTTRAIRLMLGGGGLAGATWRSAAAMRATVIGKWVGVLAGVLGLNYAMWGRSDGDDDTPFGAIKLGRDAMGRTIYLDTPASLQRRGLRAVGVLAILEGGRRHKTGGQMADRVVTDIVNSQLHPFLGPSYQLAHTALTGENAIGVRVAERVPQGQSQMAANARAALATANPAFSTLTGRDRARDQLSLPEKLMSLGGPLAPKVAHQRRH